MLSVTLPLFAKESAAFAISSLVTLALTPLAIGLAVRLKLVDRPSKHKFHRTPTPYLGGLPIALAVLTTVLAIGLLAHHSSRAALAMAGGGAAATALGLVDDWLVLGPSPRLLFQAVAGIGLWSAGFRVVPTAITPVNLLLTVLLVVIVMNAVNLLDNMDGVSSGTVAIASLCLFGINYWRGDRVTALIALVMAGSCLGFLAYNFHPARIFLGDSGTLFLGFMMAALVLRTNLRDFGSLEQVTVPLMVLAVPLFDLSLVVVSRRRAGRPVLVGGTDHSAHRLIAIGFTVRQAAMIIYGVGAISAAVSVSVLAIRREAVTGVAVALGLIGAAVLFVFFEGVRSGHLAQTGPVALQIEPSSPRPEAPPASGFATSPILDGFQETYAVDVADAAGGTALDRAPEPGYGTRSVSME